MQLPHGSPLRWIPLIYRQEGIHPRACVTDLRGIRSLPLPRVLRECLHFLYPLVAATRLAILAGRCNLLYPGPMDILLARLDAGLPFPRASSLRREAKNFACQCIGPCIINTCHKTRI